MGHSSISQPGVEEGELKLFGFNAAGLWQKQAIVPRSYGPKRCSYSPEVMKAFTISAAM